MGNGLSMPTGYNTQGQRAAPQGLSGINLKASEAYHKDYRT